MRSIDSRRANCELRAPAVIHLDVEGNGLEALRGAERTGAPRSGS
jgi:hypothetical protein